MFRGLQTAAVEFTVKGKQPFLQVAGQALKHLPFSML